MMITVVFTFFAMLTASGAVDTVLANQPIADGMSVVSQDGTFELGFFSPGSSKYRYLGIWYKNINSTVVWVANTESPLTTTSGVLMFNRERMLLLQNGTMIWSFEFKVPLTDVTAVAQLLDNGNFVIRGTSKEEIFWQSFDYPGNTYLPGMKLGQNYITGKERYLTSWRSTYDPSPGEYTMKWKMNEYPQVYKMKGSVIISRMGPWDGNSYAGLPIFSQNEISTFKLEIFTTQEESYLLYTLNSTRVLERGIVKEDGKVEFCHHDRESEAQDWMQDWTIPLDNCDSYSMCGKYGSCNTLTSPYCGCLKGFKPAVGSRVDRWSSGCQRMVALACKPKEGFLKYPGVKLPDTVGACFKEHMTLEECAVACKNNCSCIAYANPYKSAAKTGCLRWFGDLIDIRVYPQNGQDLYIRMAASELLRLNSESNKKKQFVFEVFLPMSAVLILFGIILTLYLRNKWKRSIEDSEGSLVNLLHTDHENSIEMGEIHLPLFPLSIIVMATNNFSDDNKLGEGGFGPVYKGVLEGKEVAIKRLSKSSHQGLQEFKNEITCIAKLQHRNLVKLFGYCLQGVEIMLIYEYLPNKSLDQFIFDDSKKELLDWPLRFSIINGIAKGLLYLHEDSRLRVVHRDLKADNILLDIDMNPKISDFGIARMIGVHDTEANTQKVVGTLGYISPEYAMHGIFSVKSDIFSFGVLVLEIVSGKKNRGFGHDNHEDNLLGHAWRLYKEGRSLDLADESLNGLWNVSEMTRSILIGMLCVQQRAEDRPSMSSVLFMLGDEGSITEPKQPGFFIEERESSSGNLSQASINQVTSSTSSRASTNQVTITDIYPR